MSHSSDDTAVQPEGELAFTRKIVTEYFFEGFWLEEAVVIMRIATELKNLTDAVLVEFFRATNYLEIPILFEAANLACKQADLNNADPDILAIFDPRHTVFLYQKIFKECGTVVFDATKTLQNDGGWINVLEDSSMEDKDISYIVAVSSLPSSGGDKVVMKILDCNGNEIANIQNDNSTRVSHVSCITHDYKRVNACGAFDNTLRIWEPFINLVTKDLREVAICKGHEGPISAIWATPTNKVISYSPFDNTVRLWEVSTGKQLAIYTRDQCVQSSTSLFGPSPYKTFIAEQFTIKANLPNSKENIIIIHNNLTQEERICRGHTAIITGICTTPTKVITCSADSTIRVWEIATGNQVALCQHNGPIKIICVTNDKIISDSNDNTLIVWDINTGAKLVTCQGHFGPITALRISQNKIISGSADRTVRSWNLDTGKELKTYIDKEQPCATGIGILQIVKNRFIVASCCNFFDPSKRNRGASFDGAIRIWDIETGNLHAVCEGHKSEISSFYVTSEGNIVSQSRGELLVWNTSLLIQFINSAKDQRARIWKTLQGMKKQIKK